MDECSNLTVSSVEELRNRGDVVYSLHFRFNTAHQKGDHGQIRAQVESRGWKKLSDFESLYVWSGPSDDGPPDVMDILEQYSFDNHVCRYVIGTIKSCGKLRGTGVPPAVSDQTSDQEQRVSPSTRTILDYFPKANSGDHGIQMLPKVKEVKPFSSRV